MQEELTRIGNTVTIMENEHSKKIDLILEVIVGHTEKLEEADKKHERNKKVIDIKYNCYFKNTSKENKNKESVKIVRVSVFNTGDPIPEESLPHIWEKFYKVDKARTREYGGSGVGLSIVKAIMDSMNQQYGVINYTNGVEFWFELETE